MKAEATPDTISGNRPGLPRDELVELYRRATGNRKGRGAQAWAADVLDVTPRTVRNWTTGATSPTSLQVARLRVAASVGERARSVRESRERGEGLWDRLKSIFTPDNVDQVVEDRLAEEERQRIERLARSPIFFPSRDAWLRFRREHGFSNRNVPKRAPRDPVKHPYSWLHQRSRDRI